MFLIWKPSTKSSLFLSPAFAAGEFSSILVTFIMWLHAVVYNSYRKRMPRKLLAFGQFLWRAIVRVRSCWVKIFKIVNYSELFSFCLRRSIKSCNWLIDGLLFSASATPVMKSIKGVIPALAAGDLSQTCSTLSPCCAAKKG